MCPGEKPDHPPDFRSVTSIELESAQPLNNWRCSKTSNSQNPILARRPMGSGIRGGSGIGNLSRGLRNACMSRASRDAQVTMRLQYCPVLHSLHFSLNLTSSKHRTSTWPTGPPPNTTIYGFWKTCHHHESRP